MKILVKQYLQGNGYEEGFSFSNQLKRYIKITQRSNKEIASNLNIHSHQIE